MSKLKRNLAGDQGWQGHELHSHALGSLERRRSGEGNSRSCVRAGDHRPTGPGSTTAHTLMRAFGGSETTSSVVPHFVAVVCSRTTSQMCRCTSPWMVIGRVQTQHAPFLPRHMRASCGLRRFTSLYRGVALSGRSASRRRSGKSNMAGSHLSAADQRVKRRARLQESASAA